MTHPLSVAPVPRGLEEPRRGRAGLVSRLVAATLDVLVLLVVLVLLYVAANAVVFLARPRTFSPLTAPQPVLLALTGLGAVGYLAVAWWMAGRTYGCHVMGLRVVDRRGRPPHLLVALLRAALYVVFPVGVLWCAVSRSRRSVQDLVVGSYVVYDWAT